MNKQTKKMTARLLAVTALLKMENNSGYSNIVIDKSLSESGLEARDKKLASIIFYGTLEKIILLDYYIDSCASKSKSSMDFEIRTLLRAAVYQILFLEKVPDFAVVDESVSMTRELKKPKAAGFVNAVLRSVLRRRKELAEKLEDKGQEYVKYSVPKELIALWERSYGRADTKKILDSFMEKSCQFIRINSLKTDFEGLKSRLPEGSLEKSLLIESAAELKTGSHVTELEAFKEGLFHVQDLSAQLVCEILDPQPGETVYDLCAAPGGKSFTMAQQMEDGGVLYAFDLYKSRVKLIKSGAERLGISCIKAETADASKWIGTENADKVLCDVPCSGYGVIRSKPEIRYKSLKDVKDLPEIQYEILCSGAKLVKSSGLLIYSTCTLNPAENEQVAERFLKSNKDYKPYPITKLTQFRTREEAEHMLTVMPYAAHSDGFFTAVFQKGNHSLQDAE